MRDKISMAKVHVRSIELNQKQVFYLLSFAFFVISLLFFIFQDITYRSRFLQIKREIDSVETTVRSLHQDMVVDKYSMRGDGVIDTWACLPDVTCPTGGKVWKVAIESDAEEDVLKKIIDTHGKMALETVKTISGCKTVAQGGPCGVSFTNEHSLVSVDILAPYPSQSLPEVGEKVWRRISVGVTYR